MFLLFMYEKSESKSSLFSVMLKKESITTISGFIMSIFSLMNEKTSSFAMNASPASAKCIVSRSGLKNEKEERNLFIAVIGSEMEAMKRHFRPVLAALNRI